MYSWLCVANAFSSGWLALSVSSDALDGEKKMCNVSSPVSQSFPSWLATLQRHLPSEPPESAALGLSHSGSPLHQNAYALDMDSGSLGHI